jgi:DNA-binding response OmpR family regulator
MSPRCLLIPDGLNGAIAAVANALEEAGIACEIIRRNEVGRAQPSEAVLLQIDRMDPVADIWDLHRHGHSTIVALSERPNSEECIELLNSGADYYLDAWAPLDEVVARVRVVVRRNLIMPSSTRHEIESFIDPSLPGGDERVHSPRWR